MFVGFPFIEERFSDSASRITLSWVVTALFILWSHLYLLQDVWQIGSDVGNISPGPPSLWGCWNHGWELTCDLGLILARSLQGVAIAMLSPSGLAMSLNEFPPSRRAYALGVWGTIGALTGLCGSPIAAGMIELFNWQAIFILTGGFSFLYLLRVLLSFPTNRKAITTTNRLGFSNYCCHGCRRLNPFPCSRPRMGIQFASDTPLFMHINYFNATLSQT